MDGDHQVALVGTSTSSLRLRGPRRRVLLPLGMHRSGTSLLTYLLHTLGATLPEEVVGPACGNPWAIGSHATSSRSTTKHSGQSTEAGMIPGP